MKREVILGAVIIAGLSAAALVTNWNDKRRSGFKAAEDAEALYLNESTAKRASLAFNGLAADWYWIRSLQYVGGKIVNFEDTHPNVQLTDLGSLDLHLLPSLLRMSTTLDPQFMAPYEYGAVILPALDDNQAIALLNQGIAANPNSWRLYQHLGYIYWNRSHYAKASEVYVSGSRLPGAPAWMAAMSARMKAEGGSRQAAREMYLHLDEASEDESVKRMVEHQIMRLDSLDQREAIHHILVEYSERTGRCATSWKEVIVSLRNARLRVDPLTGAPIDPSGLPYRLVNHGCDVDFDPSSKVPRP